jgi:endonuclease/exonuclease/phosphatase family metal-dependent hydrolase
LEAAAAVTRIISYNILVGGTRRVEPLLKMLSAGQPDLVGLVEAIDEPVVVELAARLGMDYRLSGRGKNRRGWQAALLSRLPIRSAKTYVTASLIKQPLLEVCVEMPDGQTLTVFVIHLTAEFSAGWRANRQRRREVQELLRLMAPRRDSPHLLLGDFNSIAPGDRVRGSAFLRFMTDASLYRQLIPSSSNQPANLNTVLPRRLRFLKPLLQRVPQSRSLGMLLDALDRLYAPRGGLELLTRAGYGDCYRVLHPREPGFTWPSALPAGRIDYLFASPALAPQLAACEVLTTGAGITGNLASDHLPVLAVFEDASENRHLFISPDA